MDKELYNTALDIYKVMWCGNYDKANELLKEYYNKRHPVFDLLMCENKTANAMLRDEKNAYKEASKFLTETTKNIGAVWKARRPALSSYLSQFGAKLEFQGEDPDSDTPQSNVDIKNVSNALWARAITAELNLMYSSVLFRQQKYLQGILDFRRSWKTYEEMDNLLTKIELQAANIPYFYEIRAIVDLGVGVFNFLCSAVPKSFLFIVEGIGFKANRQVAMKSLHRSLDADTSFRCHLATIVVAGIYAFFYNDYEKGKEIAAIGLARIPNNGFCLFTIAYIMRKEGLVFESIEKFQEVSAIMTGAEEFTMKLKYELGNSYYMLGDWANALPLIENYVNNSPSASFKALGFLQTAYCYRMLNSPQKEAEYMKRIAPSVRKNLPYDEYALRMSEKYFAKKLNEFELLLHQCFILNECSGYRKILEICDQMKTLEATLIDKLRTLAFRGFAHVHLNEFEAAKPFLLEVMSKEKEVKKEKFVLAFSAIGLADVAINEKDFVAAAMYVKKAKSYTGYDMEANFVWRIRKSEECLKNEQNNNNTNK